MNWKQLIADVIDEYLKVQMCRWIEWFRGNRKKCQTTRAIDSRKMRLLKSLACHGSLLSIFFFFYIYRAVNRSCVVDHYTELTKFVEYIVWQKISLLSLHFLSVYGGVGRLYSTIENRMNFARIGKKEPESEIKFTYVLVSPRQSEKWWSVRRWFFLIVKILFIHSKLILYNVYSIYKTSCCCNR